LDIYRPLDVDVRVRFQYSTGANADTSLNVSIIIEILANVKRLERHGGAEGLGGVFTAPPAARPDLKITNRAGNRYVAIARKKYFLELVIGPPLE
jgi:hypothetical protein